jgi:hypothetical protein
MNKILLIFMFSFLTNSLFAQKNLIEAIVYKNNGDSISGKLKYDDLFYLNKDIYLYDSQNKVLILDPEVISKFYLPSVKETHESHSITIDNLSGDGEKSISNGIINPTTTIQYAFLLKLLSSNNLNLFEYRDLNKTHFYYSINNLPLVELIHNFKYDDIKYQVKENNFYRQQISNLFEDCKSSQLDFKNISFEKSKLEDIFFRLVKCLHPDEKILESKKDKGIFSFGLVSGFTFSKFNFEGYSNLTQEMYNNDLPFSLGLSLEFAPSQKFNRLHIINEVINKFYSLKNNSGKVDFNAKYLQLNTKFRYYFHKKSKFNSFFDFGITNGFKLPLSKNELKIKENLFINNVGPRFWEYSSIAGIGVKSKKFSLQYNFGYSKKSFSPTYSLNVNQQSNYVSLTYNFN